MAIPYYNRTVNPLPCMSFPLKCTHTASKRYLGGIALTGKIRATTPVICKDDAEMRAMHSFWRDECNYGLEPFIFSGPLFGLEQSAIDFMAEFVGNFEPTKDANGIWKVTINLHILSPQFYIRDDAGELITDDNGDYVTTDGFENFHTTSDNIISYLTTHNVVV